MDISVAPMKLVPDEEKRKMFLICPSCNAKVKLVTKNDIIKFCPECDDDQIHSLTENDIIYEDDSSLLKKEIRKGVEKVKGREISCFQMINMKDKKVLKIPQGEYVLGGEGDIEQDYFCQDKYIGRKHCFIFVETSHIYIMDNDSTNYTSINGKKVYKTDGKIEVADGDNIKMADMDFMVKICW